MRVPYLLGEECKRTTYKIVRQGSIYTDLS